MWMAGRTPLSGDWAVTLDEAARWEDDDLSRLDKIPERPPTSGWGSLDQGRSLAIPASTWDVAPDYRGVSWWSTQIELSGPPAFLHFGAVRLLAEVYLDGKRIAIDLEGMTPFSVHLPSWATPGAHRLDLRVTDPGGADSWLDGVPIRWGRFRLPASHRFGGPWLPVELEERRTRVTDLWARADRELEAALVDFELDALHPMQLRVEVVGPDGDGLAEQELFAEPGRHPLALRLPRVHSYGPGHPNLHRCRVLAGGEVLAETSFGLRTLDYADEALRLNGEPFRMMSAISWGYYRRGPVPSNGDSDREVQSMLDFGLNTLSAHRHLSTPQLQDSLERHGLLLYQEPGGIAAPLFTDCGPDEQRLIERLSILRVKRLARRDRGRACLAWWNLANEIMPPYLASHEPFLSAAAAALRQEDPSRLLTVTSGWGEAPMWRPYDDTRRQSWDFHRIYTWPSAWQEVAGDEVERFLPERDQLAIDGESAAFGGIGRLREIHQSFPPDAPAEGGAGTWAAWRQMLDHGLQRADPTAVLGGLDTVTEQIAGLQAHAFARLIEAHRRVPGMHGMAINGWHQHHRIGTSGVVGPDRSPVVDPRPLARANAPRALTLPHLSRTVRVGDAFTVEAELLEGMGSKGAVTADVVFESGGEVLWKGVSPATVRLPRAGSYAVRAQLDEIEVDDVVIAVDPRPAPDVEISIADSSPELADWLSRRGVAIRTRRVGDGRPLLLVGPRGADSGTPHDLLPARVAVLHRPFGEGQNPNQEVFAGISQMERPDAGWFNLHGSWIGCWALSASTLIRGFGPPGVWGTERISLYPRVANRAAAGTWLSAAISFPDATMTDVGLPAVGATTWLEEQGHTQTLTTVLPLVERRDYPLGEAVLMDIVNWLAQE
jgi:beta-galactosidase